MQLTRAADYALRAMIHLAGAGPGQRVSSVELAVAAEVPDAFLSKVLQKLVARGLVVSYRGQGGGFQLGARPADISMLDIVEGVEGPINLNCGLSALEGCSRGDWCAAQAVWSEAQQKMRDVLAGARLDRLALDSSEAREKLAHEGRPLVSL
jgi:Rrf2 family protein